MAATNGVVLAELSFNERVTKQAQNGDALLHGRVGEAPATLNGEEFGPLWIGTMSQILDVEGHLLTGDGFRNNRFTLAKSQKIVERASLGVNRFRGKLKMTLELEPGA